MSIGVFRRRTKRGQTIYYAQLISDGALVVRSTGCSDKTNALLRAEELQAEIKRRERGVAQAYLGEVEAWTIYEDWAEPQMAPHTLEMDKLWWLKFWGFQKGQGHSCNLYMLSVPDVVAFQNHLLKSESTRGKPFSPASINACMRHLSAIISKLIKLGAYRGENQFKTSLSGRQRELRPKPKFLTPEQANTLLRAAEEQGRDFHLFVGLGMLAGMRLRETLNLRWKDVDFARAGLDGKAVGAITIWEDSDHRVKTEGSNRVVPIHPKLVPILKKYRPVGVDCRHDYVLKPKKIQVGLGYRWNPTSSLRQTSLKVLGQAVNPHMLRHTFASLLAQAGVSIYKIKNWLGHASVSTTEVYAHLSPVDSEIGKMG